MLARLLRYKPGPEWLSRSWALVIAFFTLLMILHFTFLTLTSHTLHSSTTTENATTTISSQIAPAASEATGTFKAFLNGMGISKASSSTGNKELAEAEEEYVAVCMAVKDQHLDLQEFFIHHYHHLGIRRFYIMDDGSEPPLSSHKDYGIPRKHLTFHYYDRKDRVKGMQHHVYDACINLYRERHVWMTFIDADEMFEMTGEETLTQMLERWERDRSVGALAVNWKTHGSNGVLTRPGSARKAFTDCSKLLCSNPISPPPRFQPGVETKTDRNPKFQFFKHLLIQRSLQFGTERATINGSNLL
jgi:hypothetical protein